jgi:hypothetical protein
VKVGRQTRFHRHGRACPGHPRLFCGARKKWMSGTSPGMTMLD